MLDLDQAKAHLKDVPPEEEALVADYLASAVSAFRVESKRRWAEQGEPAITVAIDPEADPIVYRFVRWVDPAVLSPDEEKTAYQWLRFTLGHWYENRQTVAVGLSLTEVPETAQKLMKLLREPTI